MSDEERRQWQRLDSAREEAEYDAHRAELKSQRAAAEVRRVRAELRSEMSSAQDDRDRMQEICDEARAIAQNFEDAVRTHLEWLEAAIEAKGVGLSKEFREALVYQASLLKTAVGEPT